MPQKRYRPEKIIAKLREAEVLRGQCKKVPEVVKVLGISEVSNYRLSEEHRDLSVSPADSSLGAAPDFETRARLETAAQGRDADIAPTQDADKLRAGRRIRGWIQRHSGHEDRCSTT